MHYVVKHRTCYLSSNIQLEIFHVLYKGSYIKITDVMTNCGITLWKRQLYNLIQQLKHYTQPDISHPFSWRQFLNNKAFFVKRIPFTNNYLLINKSFKRLTLDRLSIYALTEMEYDLFRELDKIESQYDEID